MSRLSGLNSDPDALTCTDLTLEGVRQEPDGAGAVEWRHPATGLLHRLAGPALEGVAEHAWYLDGVAHREGGPQFYDTTGVDWTYWIVHGRLHRLDGPACTMPGLRRWFVHDQQIPDDDVPVLEELLVGGETRTLELVLSTWRLDGPSTIELRDAVVAAAR